jgi:hypothetical protein
MRMLRGVDPAVISRVAVGLGVLFFLVGLGLTMWLVVRLVP